MSATTTINSEVTELCADFLETYYLDDIADAIVTGADRVAVSHTDVAAFDDDLAIDLRDNPGIVRECFDAALQYVHIDSLDTTAAEAGITLAFTDLDTTLAVGDIRADHMDRFLGINGQVTRATQVLPRAQNVTYSCARCSAENEPVDIGPVPQQTENLQTPFECPNCERKGPFRVESMDMVDHQIIQLSSEPGEHGGAVEHSVPVHLTDSLAGTVTPGDKVTVNGVIHTEDERLTGQSKTSTRRPILVDANHVEPRQLAFEEVTPTREQEIRELSEDPELEAKLIDSVAPGLLTDDRGDQVKLAVLLSLFGGTATDDGGRRDIHLFLIGDKGTGKSELLNRANELAPKSIKASGKGATAAGLTATATKSEHGEGWVLDAGALVLADGGVACVDEFDKMTEGARKSMHEALEDQEVPINKAGINTVLQTKTAVLAAANPVGGVFDKYEPLPTQIDLEAPLLSRFDLILAMFDRPDEAHDADVAYHQHTPEDHDQPVSDGLLQEYIAYARQNVHPDYESEAVKQLLVDFYVEVRQAALDEEDDTTAFGPRLNDALRRLSQASARLRLSDTITAADAERAIRLVKRHIGDVYLKPDGEIRTEPVEYETFDQHGLTDLGVGDDDGDDTDADTQHGAVHAIKAAIQSTDGTATTDDIVDATDLSRDRVEHLVQKLKDSGDIYQPDQGEYRWV